MVFVMMNILFTTIILKEIICIVIMYKEVILAGMSIIILWDTVVEVVNRRKFFIFSKNKRLNSSQMLEEELKLNATINNIPRGNYIGISMMLALLLLIVYNVNKEFFSSTIEGISIASIVLTFILIRLKNRRYKEFIINKNIESGKSKNINETINCLLKASGEIVEFDFGKKNKRYYRYKKLEKILNYCNKEEQQIIEADIKRLLRAITLFGKAKGMVSLTATILTIVGTDNFTIFQIQGIYKAAVIMIIIYAIILIIELNYTCKCEYILYVLKNIEK